MTKVEYPLAYTNTHTHTHTFQKNTRKGIFNCSEGLKPGSQASCFNLKKEQNEVTLMFLKDRGGMFLFLRTGSRQSLIFTARQFFQTGANRYTIGGGRVLAAGGRRRSEGMTVMTSEGRQQRSWWFHMPEGRDWEIDR